MLLIVLLIRLFFEELKRKVSMSTGRLDSTYLDERLRDFEKVSFALRLSALLRPVKDGLIGNYVVIVQHFEDVGECFCEARILVAVDLDRIDQHKLTLGIWAECFQDGCNTLSTNVSYSRSVSLHV